MATDMACHRAVVESLAAHGKRRAAAAAALGVPRAAREASSRHCQRGEALAGCCEETGGQQKQEGDPDAEGGREGGSRSAVGGGQLGLRIGESDEARLGWRERRRWAAAN